MDAVCAVLDRQFHAGHHADPGLACPLPQGLEFIQVELVVVGDDGESRPRGFERGNVAGDEAILLAIIAKFLIRPCVQVKVGPHPLRTTLEEFLKCLAQSLHPCG